MSETIIRTEKHLTMVEAHPYHRYISDDRPGGNVIVERARPALPAVPGRAHGGEASATRLT